ncbi:hypothetical protein Sked_03690 [Sanguibacter keddieii DSM 10542]|uniref:Bacterial Ig-like domain-containing protein n=1 Tax=Sanguibacter keddieii (strain ATCC 51767 / DSM 10542 / NCFB 3025 / ST-74) TaxID=446469 RepID=D1BJT0_SANKS|nr:Ig-like domain-containing protein [Sanguibacter keddieii]ACZ20336.1 hypothetical protein Sked_03690 [Sanguibacter keddieii DSM 10542]
MRTRRTPAPHQSRLRAASLRRVVAATLALPLALGTLAATALPAAAEPGYPTMSGAPASAKVDETINVVFTCPNVSDVDYNKIDWLSSAGNGTSHIRGTVVEDEKQYSENFSFPTAGEQYVDVQCVTETGGVPTVVGANRFYFTIEAAAPVAAPTTTAARAYPEAVEPGNPIGVEATVSTKSGLVSDGTVQFSLNGDPVGSAVAVDSHGYVSTSIPNPGWGTYTVGASYAGTELFEASNGQDEVWVKSKAIVTSVVPDRVRAPFTTLRASVAQTAGLPVPSGTVTFRYSEGARLGSAPLVDGTAVLQLPELAHGIYPEVFAVYSGDENYGDGSTGRRDMIVDKALPVTPVKDATVVTVDVPATIVGSSVKAKISVAPGMHWTAVGVAAARTPSGTVSVSLAKGGPTQKVTLVEGTATVVFEGVKPGTYEIEGSYTGDEYFDVSVGSATTVVEALPVVTPPTPVNPKVTVPATVTTTVGTPATFTVGLPAENRPVALRVTGTDAPIDLIVPATGDVTVALPVLAPGTHEVVVETAASKTLNGTKHTVRVVVTGEPAKGSTTPNADLTGSTKTLVTGKKITLVARDFLPGETVAFYLHSDPVFLGTAVADENGVATLVVALPAGVPAGAHHVQATGGTSGRWAEIPVTVTEGTPAVETPVETGPIVTVPVAAPVAPVVAAPAAAAPAASTAVTAAPLAATGAETGSTALLVSVLLTSGALLLAGRRRFSTPS